MKTPPYRLLTMEFTNMLHHHIYTLEVLVRKGTIHYIDIYHLIHQVKHSAENAITELDNLKLKLKEHSNP